MHIQVLFREISYDSVCDYYNSHRPEEWNPLQELERAEGGFSVAIPNYEPDLNNIFSYDANAKIKQLRWQNKHLKAPAGLRGFNKEETELLYHSLCNVYGEDQVILHTN